MCSESTGPYCDKATTITRSALMPHSLQSLFTDQLTSSWKHSPFISSPCFRYLSSHSSKKYLAITISFQGQDQDSGKGISLLCPSTVEQAPTISPLSLLYCNFWKHLKNSCLTLSFRHDYQHTRLPVNLMDCFMDFAVRHWLGCSTTKPHLARNIGYIEINWLIDWLIEFVPRLIYKVVLCYM